MVSTQKPPNNLEDTGVKWNKKIQNTKSDLSCVPIEHRRLSEFLQTRRPELTLDSPPGLLLLAPSLEKHYKDLNFDGYVVRNFTNYRTDRLGGADSLKTYSSDRNLPVDSFRRYSRDSTGHKDKFNNYASNRNVVDQGFNGYATGFTGRSGEFVKSDSVNAGVGFFVNFWICGGGSLGGRLAVTCSGVRLGWLICVDWKGGGGEQKGIIYSGRGWCGFLSFANPPLLTVLQRSVL
ncbi:polygalacturonase 1 beta-like protein 1 [Quercus suber]|uniref:Polygalacturonase 1 beta-like protein 1 n=1 Tax=Quercus suber TaxID=58331 RepID=A0AAW0LPA6_QUESU